MGKNIEQCVQKGLHLDLLNQCVNKETCTSQHNYFTCQLSVNMSTIMIIEYTV